MQPINIPVVGIGSGSQPGEEDGADLAYLSMPSGMATYMPPPLPEPDEIAELATGLACMDHLQQVLSGFRVVDPPATIDLAELDQANGDLVNQTLGEGEVSILYTGSEMVRIQETRLAGVWRVRIQDETGRLERDVIEVADIPELVRTEAFRSARAQADLGGEAADGVLNAPPVLVEINDRTLGYRPGDEAHVINLTLLPQTEQDLAYLDAHLGTGPVSILSRGYGNCRIIATSIDYVWWVRYFNSEETLILNTIEVVDVPTAALAAREDIEDSTARLAEILEALR